MTATPAAAPPFNMARTATVTLVPDNGKPGTRGMLNIAGPADLVLVQDATEIYGNTGDPRSLLIDRLGNAFVVKRSAADIIGTLVAKVHEPIPRAVIAPAERVSLESVRKRPLAYWTVTTEDLPQTIDGLSPHAPKGCTTHRDYAPVKTGGPGLLSLDNLLSVRGFSIVPATLMTAQDPHMPVSNEPRVALTFSDGNIGLLDASAPDFWAKLQNGKTAFCFEPLLPKDYLAALGAKIDKFAPPAAKGDVPVVAKA